MIMIKRFDDDYDDSGDDDDNDAESYDDDDDENIDNEFDANCPNWVIGENHLVMMVMRMRVIGIMIKM